MDFLIFGFEKPKLNFRQDLERGTVIWCDNEYVLDYDANKPIKWRDIKYKQSEMREIDRIPLPELSVSFEQEWHDVIKELKGLCQTNVERIFLEKIARAQENRMPPPPNEELKERTYEVLLNRPALIPQVWVNWIHWDPKDKERAKKSHCWGVCRFSTLEVEKENCDYLYFEMQGEAESLGVSPDYFPYKD